MDVIGTAVSDLLKSTLDECVRVRVLQREGKEFQFLLEDHLKISKKLISSIKKRMPILLKAA